MLAVGTAKGSIMILDQASGNVRLRFHAHSPGFVESLVVSPCGSALASVGGMGASTRARVWDAATGEERAQLTAHDGQGECSCSVDEEGAVAIDRDCVVVGHSAEIQTIAWSPCGLHLASGGKDRDVVIWDAWTGRGVAALKGHWDDVLAVAFSHDGQRVAGGGGGYDGRVFVWDVPHTRGAKAGEVRLRMEGHVDGVWALAFSPTGGILASGGEDRMVRLWDSLSGQALRVLAGHASVVLSLAFSPDGRSLASGGDDFSVRVWAPQDGALLECKVEGHPRGVHALAFAPDGRALASGGPDGVVLLWNEGGTGGAGAGRDVQGGRGARGVAVGRAVQSLAFARDWLREYKGLAFAMGLSARLGEHSPILSLEEGVVRLILDAL